MIDEKRLAKEIRDKIPPEKFGERCNTLDVIYGVLQVIDEQPKVGEWIPCSERLPENSKQSGAFCPKYQVMTKYGITEGWYNPDMKSWYFLAWFFFGKYDETDIDFEKGDKPKVLRAPDGTGIVTAWRELPKPGEGEDNE